MPNYTRKPLNVDGYNDAKTWELPSVDGGVNHDNGKTNAFNRPSNWRYEPPEEVSEEELKPLTAEDIEAIRQSAYDEGFNSGKEDGFAKGHAEGLEQGISEGIEQGSIQGLASAEDQIAEQTHELKAHLESLIVGITQPLNQVNRSLEKELLILSVKLAEAVLAKTIDVDHDILLNAITEALKVLPINDEVITFKMNPDDIAIVYDQYGAEKIAKHNWTFAEDNAMQRGGCELSTENHSVDFSIEKRCAQVFEHFLSAQGIGNDPRLD